MKGCNLSYAEHETALIVTINDSRELNDIPELQPYLLSCKELCEDDKYAGFAFMKKE